MSLTCHKIIVINLIQTQELNLNHVISHRKIIIGNICLLFQKHDKLFLLSKIFFIGRFCLKHE